MKRELAILISSLALSFVGCAQEQAEKPQDPVSDAEPATHAAVEAESGDGYSPYARGYTLGPEIAYQFARGDEIVTSHGEKVRLSRALDFVVVADHAYTSPIWHTP